MPTDRHVDQYAEALLYLSQAEDVLAETEQQTLDLLDLIETRPDLRAFLGDPLVDEGGKQAAIAELLDGRVLPHLRQFVLTLQAQGRFQDLRAIAECFFTRASAQGKRMSGRLVSARPLDEDFVHRVEEAVGQAMGRDVHLLLQVAPSLLGGMRVEVGDFVVDGTLDRYLEDARRALQQ